MKALLCSRFGALDDLAIGEMASLSVQANQVRIRVQACGLNFPDVLLVKGEYQARPNLPFAPGGEIAGVVVEVGSGVESVIPGDKVMAVIFWGGIAQEVVVSERALRSMPDCFDFVSASVFSGCFSTAYYALKQCAGLTEGETLLVLGAAGGVGLATVQLGKVMGARVIAVAGSREKCELTLRYGADHTINYRSENLKDAVKARVGERGVDVVLDPIGGDVFDHAVRCVARGGRILVVGFTSGRIPSYPVNLALLKGNRLIGVNYQHFVEDDFEQARNDFLELVQMADKGLVKPHIDRVFPFEQAIDALRYMGSGQVKGKVAVALDH